MLGTWEGGVAIPATDLESAEQRLSGVEKEQFLNFISKMLQWKPEDRASLDDIFWDEWLLADLIKSGKVAITDD